MIEKEPENMVQYIIYFWKQQFRFLYNYFFEIHTLKNKLSTIYEESNLSSTTETE